MSSLNLNQMQLKREQLQQRAHKRQAAAAMVAKRAKIEKTKAKIAVVQVEIMEAKIDLARIDKAQSLKYDKQADLKESEAALLRQKARLCTLQEELKELKNSATKALDPPVVELEAEPTAGQTLDQIEKTFDADGDLDAEGADNESPVFEIAFAKLVANLEERKVALPNRGDDDAHDGADNESPVFDLAFAKLVANLEERKVALPENGENVVTVNFKERKVALPNKHDAIFHLERYLNADTFEQSKTEIALQNAIRHTLRETWPQEDLLIDDAILLTNRISDDRFIGLSVAETDSPVIHGMQFQLDAANTVRYWLPICERFTDKTGADGRVGQLLNRGIDEVVGYQTQQLLQATEAERPVLRSALNETVLAEFLEQWPDDARLLNSAVLDLEVKKHPKARSNSVSYQCATTGLVEQQGDKPFVIYCLLYTYDSHGQRLECRKERRAYVRSKTAHDRAYKWLHQ